MLTCFPPQHRRYSIICTDTPPSKIRRPANSAISTLRFSDSFLHYKPACICSLQHLSRRLLCLRHPCMQQCMPCVHSRHCSMSCMVNSHHHRYKHVSWPTDLWRPGLPAPLQPPHMGQAPRCGASATLPACSVICSRLDSLLEPASRRAGRRAHAPWARPWPLSAAVI